MNSAMVPSPVFTLNSWNSNDNGGTIENEEWLAFLQRNMEEMMTGQLDCLKNTNLVSVVIAPLRNSNASPKVLENVANMLSLPFVINETSDKIVENIDEVYLEAKVVPNLINASKIIAHKKSSTYSNSPASSGEYVTNEFFQLASNLSADELQALESICVLICYLVHCNKDFLIQFCDAVAILNATTLFQELLLLSGRKLRIVTDILSIFILILQELPENAGLVEQIVLAETFDISNLIVHQNTVVRFRTCELLKKLTTLRQSSVVTLLASKLEQDCSTLLTDSSNSVNLAAIEVLQHIKKMTISKPENPQ